jgi:hypothetical protein
MRKLGRYLRSRSIADISSARILGRGQMVEQSGGSLRTHADDLMQLAAAGRELQIRLGELGLEFNFRPGTIELVVHKTGGLRITMDGDRDSHAPHVHIDLGKDKHAGSYTIRDGERVAGEKTKFDGLIKQWILENREILERVYRGIRANGYNPEDVITLLETAFPEKNKS